MNEHVTDRITEITGVEMNDTVVDTTGAGNDMTVQAFLETILKRPFYTELTGVSDNDLADLLVAELTGPRHAANYRKQWKAGR